MQEDHLFSFSFVEEKKTAKKVIDHGTGDDAMKILGRPQEVPHILFRLDKKACYIK